jgi:putative phage-type endonuclease
MMEHELVQGTEDWLRARLGKVTASRIADVMAKTKTGYSTSRANYAAQLVCERMTGMIEPGFSSPAMQWGTDKEPEARMAYEFLHNEQVDLVGFINHPTIDMSGASPDGLVGALGLVEIKCPNTATHIATMMDGKPANKYWLQMQWQMACAEREWCDFVSYDPRMREDLRLFSTRIERDDRAISEICEEIVKFQEEVAAMIEKLNQRAGMIAALKAA